MRTLAFLVENQTLSKHGDFSGLVAGSKGYLHCWFRFSSDWAGYRKVAVFTCPTGEYPVLIVGGTCAVPDEAAACTSFKVHVVGRRNNDDIKSGRATVIQRRH